MDRGGSGRRGAPWERLRWDLEGGCSKYRGEGEGKGIPGKEAHRPWLGAPPVWVGWSWRGRLQPQVKVLNVNLRASTRSWSCQEQGKLWAQKGDPFQHWEQTWPLFVHLEPARSLSRAPGLGSGGNAAVSPASVSLPFTAGLDSSTPDFRSLVCMQFLAPLAALPASLAALWSFVPLFLSFNVCLP